MENKELGYKCSADDWKYILTDCELGELLMCPVPTARRWWREAKAGKVEAHSRSYGTRQRMTEDVKDLLYNLVLENKFASKYFLKIKLAAITGMDFHEDYIIQTMRRMDLSRKKVCYEKKSKMTVENMQYYFEWVQTFKRINRNCLVFVDQTGFDGYDFLPKYGYGPSNQRIFAAKQPNKGTRISITGLLPYGSGRSPFFFQMANSHGTYELWESCVVEAINCGFLKVGDVLVVDNWSGFVGYNTGMLLSEVLSEVGIFVWPLPRYSPELNPIELLWNWLKQYVARSDIIPETEIDRCTYLHTILSRVRNTRPFFDHVEKYVFSNPLW